jgi:predicted RNA binding protein YcfA (HicA-like mRNA interferase family)
MSNKPALTPKKIAAILMRHGFELDRMHGSNQIWLHPVSRKRVVVPFHKRDLPMGTLLSILKQAGIGQDQI